MKKYSLFLLGLFLGAIITLWVSSFPIFKPFNFGFVESDSYILFLQQSIELPIPMADHVTSVWIKDKNKPHHSNPWVYIGKVYTDPFPLNEVKILENETKIKIDFPWGASLSSDDLKSWSTQ